MSKIYTALGLMSGTSLDGIDIALLRTDGESIVEQGPSQTFSYDATQQTLLRQALRDAEAVTDRTSRLGVLGEAEREVGIWHAEAVTKFLDKNEISKGDVDVIGFHGQTVLHRPHERLTLQLGSGQALAEETGIAVVYDMRAADVSAGGQGAPLVPIYHAALSKMRPSVFVNIGGVANVTSIGDDGALLAFDTGPGNALLNDWMMKHRGVAFDDGGNSSLSGKVSAPHVAKALSHSFFEQAPPKSLDRNSFGRMDFSDLNFEDGAATLAAFTVEALVAAQRWFPNEPKQWVICGGGRYNKAIMKGLRARLDSVVTAEDLNLNGDSIEAEAWAYLAVRCLKGLPITFPGTTGVAKPMTGGVIVMPN